ncbi:type II toxin-antitoxin system RelE/ParE family toxin [Asticcacaulis excentricus]|uniref:Plasmid stabilization system n=1 Tax=Asticcacaulis excentricus (strain ATCC 15261 / DSM 4724 / KCTC 12464 / NCIMB 9791 / VKM B-1370 / CB 48) TaxID=573065 RepID=E8RSW1_ASTEC|nr:type II toxin-antitoxin system RelE/ParE family toxin [Asticcacaulis excentricus]ADU14582.1 plasmid stabilization system [Asticcacaulis excentricus CB 48]
MAEYLFEFTPVARREVIEASRWYASKNPRLGRRFNQQVTDVLADICRSPFRNAEVQSGLRRARLADFPYHLYYRLEDRTLYVAAVLHTRRNPSAWKKRE